MRYFCIDCSYIYDEAFGEEELGIEANMRFDDIPDFYCPNCEAESDMFQPIIEEVLYAENPQKLSDIEKEHIPHILHTDTREVEVSIGVEVHPMQEDHRIASVALYDEHGDMIEEHLFEVDEDPIYAFSVEDLDSFELRAYCNEHGVWSTGIIENELIL